MPCPYQYDSCRDTGFCRVLILAKKVLNDKSVPHKAESRDTALPCPHFGEEGRRMSGDVEKGDADDAIKLQSGSNDSHVLY
jgi:hypothetical protein